MQLALLPGLILALAVGGPVNAGQAPGLYSVAAQAATTGTVTVAATGTPAATQAVTSTVVANTTPAPLPTVGPQTNLRLNPFDWGFLSSAPSPTMGPFAWIYLVVMLVVLGASVYFYFFKRNEWKRTNPVLRRTTERWAPWFMWVSGLALVWLVFRVIGFDFFNLRIWLYLWTLALIVLAGWFYYWYRTAYPKEVAKYQKQQKARQYMPNAKKGSVRVPAGGSRPAPAPKAGNPKSPSTPASTTATTGGQPKPTAPKNRKGK